MSQLIILVDQMHGPRVILEKFSVGLFMGGSLVFGLDWNEDCHWEIAKIC